MTLRACAFVLLSALPLAACATVEEVESAQPSDAVIGEDFTNPAAGEGQYELDSDLCWQSIQASDSREADQQAWEECMRKRGWTRSP